MSLTPNAFAYLALLAWVPFTLLLFWRLPARVAAAASFLGGGLFLPVLAGFELPRMPTLDRDVIGSLSVALGCLLFHRRALRFWERMRLPELLVGVLLVSPLLTALANGDTLQYGPTVLPGQTLWEGLGESFFNLITLALPFLLGRHLLRRSGDLRPLFTVLVLYGLVYSVLILWELRMSPNLHNYLYGYHPHSFSQHARYGGWRPMVFTSHGLALSLFVAMAAIAAFALARARLRPLGLPALPLGVYLTGILVATKSLAATLYGLAAIPLVLFTRPRLQVTVAAGLAAFILVYPLLRAYDLVPTGAIHAAAQRVSAERAQSLDYRFQNEDLLLAKARERQWLGWGAWGRNRIYDPRDGKDLSVTDGYWIVALGSQGLVGYFAHFGLLLSPILLAARQLGRIRDRRQRIQLGALALLLALACTDLLPNSHLASYQVFLAGSLDGALRIQRGARRRATAPARRGAPAVTEARRIPGFG